jgi:hypothetical protein
MRAAPIFGLGWLFDGKSSRRAPSAGKGARLKARFAVHISFPARVFDRAPTVSRGPAVSLRIKDRRYGRAVDLSEFAYRQRMECNVALLIDIFRNAADAEMLPLGDIAEPVFSTYHSAPLSPVVRYRQRRLRLSFGADLRVLPSADGSACAH